MRKDVWRRFRRNRLAHGRPGLHRLADPGRDLRPADRAVRSDQGPRPRATSAKARRASTGSAPTRSAGTCSAASIYGARISLRIGIIATVIVADHRRVPRRDRRLLRRRHRHACIMRLTDVFLAIPYIVLAVAIATILGRSENTVILVLGLTGWLGITRIVRAELPVAASSWSTSRRRARSGYSRTRIIVPPHPAQRAAADHRLRHDRGRHA